MHIKAVIAWIIAALVFLFMAQNFETVQISLLIWTVELPRALMILLVFAAGALLGWLIATVRGLEKQGPKHGQ